MQKSITPADITSFQKQLQAKAYAPMQRAVTSNGIFESSANNALSLTNTTIFSDEIETSGVTNQESSGRCWLFATLNTVRHQIEKDYKIESFELSQSYSFFWDKLEKSNVFLQRMVNLADKPLDDREVTHFLDYPQGDGGWWEYAAAIIMKYGVVPKSAMPEAKATSRSHHMNVLLDRKLRKGALELRGLVAAQATDKVVSEAKEAILANIYRFLTITIGTPPTSFDFIYKDKDKKYHRDNNITPLEFYKKYTHDNLGDYVSVLNDPTTSKSYGKTYQFEHGGNVVDGVQPLFLNVDIKTLKGLAYKQIKAGETMWFGCDVHADSNKEGYMSLDTYDFSATFGIDFSLDKAQRLMSRDSSVTHAMTITGVDVVKGKPTQWKVENSWGDEAGLKGYYTMSNDWFDKNGYVVVIRKDLLSDEQRVAIDQPPIIIPNWDPLNSLPN